MAEKKLFSGRPVKVGNTVKKAAELAVMKDARQIMNDVGTLECPGLRDRKTLHNDERKSMILLMIADGVSRREMSEILGIGKAQVALLVKNAKAYIGETIRSSTVEEYAGVVRIRMERIFNRLMTEGRTAREPQHRILALEKAMKTMSELVRCLQQMGIVYKEPERIRIENEVRVRMVTISRVFIDGMDRFLEGDAKKQFGKYIGGKMKELGLGESS